VLLFKLGEQLDPDVAAWDQMCTSFQRIFDYLCEVLAGVARRLHTGPFSLTALAN